MRTFAFLSKVVIVIWAFVAPAQGQNGVADVILVNAKVFTASDSHPYAEAVAIKGERILAVGTNQKIKSLAGPKTKRIDARGRLVVW